LIWWKWGVYNFILFYLLKYNLFCDM
jgi:hypothetical protein